MGWIMNKGTLIFAAVAAILCAAAPTAQAYDPDAIRDPEAYRSSLLSQPLQDGHANFCRQKGGSQADCQVTLNFLKDINAGKVPRGPSGKEICPRGASIDYSGNEANKAKIEARCT